MAKSCFNLLFYCRNQPLLRTEFKEPRAATRSSTRGKVQNAGKPGDYDVIVVTVIKRSAREKDVVL